VLSRSSFGKVCVCGFLRRTHSHIRWWLRWLYSKNAKETRFLKIIGLFCKRALWKRLYSAKETYNFKEPNQDLPPNDGVPTISRFLKIIGLFCKRALWKRLYSAKLTYNCKEPNQDLPPNEVTVLKSLDEYSLFYSALLQKSSVRWLLLLIWISRRIQWLSSKISRNNRKSSPRGAFCCILLKRTYVCVDIHTLWECVLLKMWNIDMCDSIRTHVCVDIHTLKRVEEF